MVPFISVTVRRLHDTDRSGWWLVAAFPIAVAIGALAVTSSLNGSDSLDPWMIAAIVVFAVYAIALFIFTVLPGTEGPNRYGLDPYGPHGLEEVFA